MFRFDGVSFIDQQAIAFPAAFPDAGIVPDQVFHVQIRILQPLLDGAKRYFDKYIFHASKGIQFALASLGNDAGAYGAFKLVLDRYG